MEAWLGRTLTAPAILKLRDRLRLSLPAPPHKKARPRDQRPGVVIGCQLSFFGLLPKRLSTLDSQDAHQRGIVNNKSPADILSRCGACRSCPAEQQPPLIGRPDFQLIDACRKRLILVGGINRRPDAVACWLSGSRKTVVLHVTRCIAPIRIGCRG